MPCYHHHLMENERQVKKMKSKTGSEQGTRMIYESGCVDLPEGQSTGQYVPVHKIEEERQEKVI